MVDDRFSNRHRGGQGDFRTQGSQFPLERAEHPNIEWSTLPPWANQRIQQYNQRGQGRIELHEDTDQFGNPFTRMNWYKGQQGSGVEHPSSYGLYYNKQSQSLAVNRGGSSAFKLLTGSVDVTGGTEDEQPSYERMWSVEENFSRFLDQPNQHFRNQPAPGRGAMLFSQNVSQLNPNILRSNTGAVQLPKNYEYFNKEGKRRLGQVQTETEDSILDQMRMKDELYFVRDHKAMSATNYYPNAETAATAMKDERRLFRPTDSMLNANFQPRPVESSAGYFEGQSPVAGTRMNNLFLDDPILFSEGNALTLSGKNFTSTPTSYTVPKSKGKGYDFLESMGFSVGTLYGDREPKNLQSGMEYGGRRKRLGEYALGNSEFTFVAGATYDDEYGWTVNLNKINPFEDAENKSHPGVKRVNIGVNESNPLFRSAYGQGMAPESISPTPSKPARLLENARAGLWAASADEQVKYYQQAARAAGISDKEANAMIRLRDSDAGRKVEFMSGTAPIFDAAAMDYMRSKSGKMRVNAVVSKFALDEMKERMSPEEYERRYGKAIFSDKGNSAVLNDYEVGYTSMDLLETPHGLSTSGETRMSAHRLNLLSRNQPAAFEEITQRDRQGEFANNARQFLRADMANQGQKVKNNTINIHDLNLKQYYATAKYNVGGEDHLVYEEMLDLIAADHGNTYIEAGGVNLPSAKALKGLIGQVDFSEDAYRGEASFGREVGEFLVDVAQGNTDGKRLGQIKNSLHNYALQESVQESAKSITAGALTGAAKGLSVLPQGYAIAHESDIMSYIKGMSIGDDARSDVMKRFMAGEGVVGNLYMQESNEYTSSAMVRVLTLQQAMKQFSGLEDVTVRRGQSLLSAEDVAALDKDEDGDPASVLLMAVSPDAVDFNRQKDTKHWGRGGEIKGWLDKVAEAGKATALMAMDSWDFVKNKAGYRDLKSHVADADEARRAKAAMGKSFGPFVENMGSMVYEVGKQAEVENITALQAAAAFSGNQVYQQAMDLKTSQSESTNWISKFLNSFAIGNRAYSKEGSTLAPSGFKGKRQGDWALSGDMAKLSMIMFSGMNRMEVGAQKSVEEDAAQYLGEGKSPGFASFFARLLAPLKESGNEERVSAIQAALEENYKDADNDQMTKQLRLLSAMSGKQYSQETANEFLALNREDNLVGYGGSRKYKRGENEALDDLMSLMVGAGSGSEKERLQGMSAMGAYMLGAGAANTKWNWHLDADGSSSQSNNLIGYLGGIMNTIRKGEQFRKGDTEETIKQNPRDLRDTTLLSQRGTSYLADALLRDGFQRGGYTGDGQRDEAAGIVHAGEYVLNQRDVDAIRQGHAPTVMRKVTNDLAREGELTGYEDGGLVNAYHGWSDEERSILAQNFEGVQGRLAQLDPDTRRDAFNTWKQGVGQSLGRSAGAVDSELRHMGMLGADSPYGRAIGGGSGGSGGGGGSVPPAPPPEDDRDRYLGPLALGRDSRRPTEATTGKTETVGRVGFGGYAAPSQMTISANSSGEYGVAVQVPYSEDTIEDMLARYASRLTVGRGEGAEEVLQSRSFQSTLKDNMTRVDEYLGMDAAGRIGAGVTGREEFERSLGALQMVEKNVKAMQAAGQGARVPDVVGDRLVDIGASLQNATSQGFSGETQAAYEQRQMKAAAGLADRSSNAKMTATDVQRFDELGRWVDSLGDMEETIGRITEGQERFVKHGSEMVSLFDTAVATLQEADKALASVGGDRNLVDSHVRGVLDQAGSGAGSLRETLLSGGSSIEGVRAALVTDQVRRRSQVYDSEDLRQADLSGALLAGGVSGGRRRSELSDEAYEGGLDVGFGTVKNRSAINALGVGARVANRLSSAMWGWSHFNQNIVAPMQGYAQQYEQSVMNRGQAMAMGGGVGYDELMGGEYGTIMRRQAGMQQFQQGIGRQVYNTYAGLFNNIDPQAGGRTAGAAIAIGGPAIGAAMTVTQMSGNAFMGAIAGAGAGAVAGYGWLNGASQDREGLSQTRNTLESNWRRYGDTGNFLNRLRGSVDTFLADPAGATALAFSSNENYDAAGRYGQLTQMTDLYISGGSQMSPEQLRTMSDLGGNSRGDLQQALQYSYLQDGLKRGLSEDQSLSTYTFGMLYGGQQLDDPLLRSMDQYNMMGQGNIAQTASQLALAMNVGAGDIRGQYGLASELNSYLDTLPLEERYARQQGLIAQSPDMGTINQARTLSGQDRWNVRDWGMFFPDDPARAGVYAQQEQQFAQAMIYNPVMAEQLSGMTSGIYDDLASGDAGRLMGAQQRMSRFSSMNSYSMEMQMGGVLDNGRQTAALTNYMNMSNVQASMVDRSMKLDPYALTQQGLFNMVDLQTGYDSFTFGNQNYSALQRVAGRFGMSAGLMGRDEWAGGTAAMQGELWANQRSQVQQQYDFGRNQQLMGMQLQMGGASGVDALGYALGGDGLQQLQQMLGGNFNVGNGMGVWQLQDAQTRLGRQQQDFGLMQQGQSLALNRQSFQQQGSQFYERMSLQERQIAFDQSRTQTEMGISRQQQITRAGWQMEDIEFGRASMDVQFGWQQEDFGRNIRYARGMDKRNLMREQDRSVVMYGMQAGQSDRQRGRAEQEQAWAGDEFQRQKEYFEQNKQFQQESINLQKQHFEQDRNLDRQRMQMAEEAHTKQVQWLIEERAFEDQNRLLERQFWQAQQEMNLKFSQTMFEMDQRARDLSTNLQLASMAMQDLSNQAAAMRNSGELFEQASGGVTTGGTNSLGSASGYTENNIMTAADGKKYKMVNGGWVPMNSPAVSGGGSSGQLGIMAAGGYTGRGGKYDPKGIVVHGDEHVVPSEGLPVIRGDQPGMSKLVDLLGQLVSIAQQTADRAPAAVDIQLKMPGQAIPVTQRSRAKV